MNRKPIGELSSALQRPALLEPFFLSTRCPKVPIIQAEVRLPARIPDPLTEYPKTLQGKSPGDHWLERVNGGRVAKESGRERLAVTGWKPWIDWRNCGYLIFVTEKKRD
jgi:hypothetical protein